MNRNPTIYEIAEQETPTAAVAYAIADQKNIPPQTVEPLHHTIDGDALNQILEKNSEIELTFTHANVTVTIDGKNERIKVI